MIVEARPFPDESEAVMTILTLDPQHVDILQQFGDIQELLEALIHRYTVEQTQQKIAALQREVAIYEQKYGVSYQEFERKVATDEAFIRQVEAVDALWERNSNLWLYAVEELKLWQTRLASISST